MPRGHRSPGHDAPASSNKLRTTEERATPVAPRRKRPLLLAAAVVLLLAWLGFLVVLALRG